MLRRFVYIMALTVLMLPTTVFAGIFTVYLESEGQEYTQDFSAFSSVIDELDTDQIEQNLSSYTETSAATGYIDFRGLPINLNMSANSTLVRIEIPSIGVTKEFSGTDRDDSIDMMEDWLKEDGDGVVSKLMEKLAAETATDPVAGNPASAQSRMAAMDFDYAVNSDGVIEMNTNEMAQSSGLNANMVSIFARYNNYDLDGTSSSTFSMPLAYTIKFNNSKNSFSIRVPVSVVDVDGSKAYNVGLGLGFSYFIKNNWSLTPAIGYTAVGSVDLASVAQLVSASVTSAYGFQFDKYTLTMGNMIGQYKTIPFSYDDYSVDADIENTVVRNGLTLNIPVDQMAKGTSFEFFVADTRYFGSELFIDQYNEIGFSYGFAKISQKEKNDKIVNVMRKMRVGATYLTAKNANGYSVNFGFSF